MGQPTLNMEKPDDTSAICLTAGIAGLCPKTGGGVSGVCVEKCITAGWWGSTLNTIPPFAIVFKEKAKNEMDNKEANKNL
jgi:hypothetical protein